MNRRADYLAEVMDRRPVRANLDGWAMERLTAVLAEQPDEGRAFDAVARALRTIGSRRDALRTSTRLAGLAHQTLVPTLSKREAAERAFANRVVE